jgi:branched-chain amino acid transport system substrate-binding protein
MSREYEAPAKTGIRSGRKTRMAITRRAALAASVASFAIIGRARADDTIKIGMVSPLTGAGADPGRIQRNCGNLALAHVNDAGGVLGKKLEIVVEDDQTTNPGVVLAFSRLVSRGDCVAYLGSIRSTQVNAMAPDVAKAAKPVMFGGTDPTLTHMGNRWLFRCRPNDSYSARVIADFAINGLKKQKLALVNSTDAFGTGGKSALVDSLDKLGVKPVLVQGFTNNAPDFTPVVLAVRHFTFENDCAVFARQLKQLGVSAPWVGSASLASPVTIKLAGAAVNGTYSVADFNEDANPEAKAMVAEYRKAYKNETPDGGWTYDAVTILAKAMNQAGSTDPEKVRSAILSIHGFKATEGEYNFDQNGDGLHGYDIVRPDAAKGFAVFDRRIDFEA